MPLDNGMQRIAPQSASAADSDLMSGAGVDLRQCLTRVEVAVHGRAHRSGLVGFAVQVRFSLRAMDRVFGAEGMRDAALGLKAFGAGGGCPLLNLYCGEGRDRHLATNGSIAAEPHVGPCRQGRGVVDDEYLFFAEGELRASAAVRVPHELAVAMELVHPRPSWKTLLPRSEVTLQREGRGVFVWDGRS